MGKTILVDCDDVLIDLVGKWIETLNETYGTRYTKSDVKDWELTGLFPDVPKEQLCIPLQGESIWKEMKPVMGAAKWLRTLMQEGYDVYIVTATDYRNIRWKVENILNRYFSFIPLDHLITCYKKQMIKADFLVDDYRANLEGGEYNKILFTACHNRQDKNVWPNSDIYRANNWQDVYNIIHKIQEQRT